MKLFLYALMTTFLFVGVGCESYHRDNSSDIQQQQEREENKPGLPESVETKPFPDKGGNAGNK